MEQTNGFGTKPRKGEPWVFLGLLPCRALELGARAGSLSRWLGAGGSEVPPEVPQEAVSFMQLCLTKESRRFDSAGFGGSAGAMGSEGFGEERSKGAYGGNGWIGLK